jgi:hypothetical protein
MDSTCVDSEEDLTIVMLDTAKIAINNKTKFLCKVTIESDMIIYGMLEIKSLPPFLLFPLEKLSVDPSNLFFIY